MPVAAMIARMASIRIAKRVKEEETANTPSAADLSRIEREQRIIDENMAPGVVVYRLSDGQPQEIESITVLNTLILRGHKIIGGKAETRCPKTYTTTNPRSS
jgi:hypothetical protein